MQTRFVLVIGAVAALAACATGAPVPAGLEAGRFVNFDCDGQDFQARFDPDGKTVRVRTHHGAAELAPAGDGVFQGEGFKLVMRGAAGVTIEHGGKALGRNCKRV